LKNSVENNIANSIKTELARSQINCTKIQVDVNIDEETGICINSIKIKSNDIERSKQIISALLEIDKNKITSIEN
jgi:hypothetical protein